MAFDLSDEFHAHAYFAVSFWCEVCHTTLPLTSTYEAASDEWCIETAGQARAAGWRLPAAGPDGTMDVWTAYCARCAVGRPGLVG